MVSLLESCLIRRSDDVRLESVMFWASGLVREPWDRQIRRGAESPDQRLLRRDAESPDQ